MQTEKYIINFYINVKISNLLLNCGKLSANILKMYEYSMGYSDNS